MSLPVTPTKIDTRLPIQKLLDSMAIGGRNNKKKGWYRESLNLSNYRPGERTYLNNRERLTEKFFLDQYTGDKAESDTTRGKKRKRSFNKFKKESRKGFDPTSKRYFFCQAWRVGNNFKSRFKKKLREGTNTDYDVPDIIVFGGEEDNTMEILSAIDYKRLASERYKAKYLFILNECKINAEDDLRYVTQDEFIDRNEDAAVKFDHLTKDHQLL